MKDNKKKDLKLKLKTTTYGEMLQAWLISQLTDKRTHRRHEAALECSALSRP
jgi:hypothetical protein